MTPILRYSLRFIFVVLAQFILLKNVQLGGFISPYFYFLYILWLPFTISKNTLLIVSVLFGLALDYLVLTPGLHGSTCLLIAYLRPYILNLTVSRDLKTINYAEPSVRSMSLLPYCTYVVILTIIHNAYLIFIQWLSVGDVWFFLRKLIITSLVALLLAGIIEIIFQRTLKTRASLN
jgi:hypothetical protein